MIDNKIADSNKKKKIVVTKKIKTGEIGNYILEQTIDKNSFSKTKIGMHKILGEKVQIKIIKVKDNLYISKIKHNIEIMRHLHHKNILQLYEIFEEKNKLYIITQYCELTLSNYIMNQKKLNESDICRLFQQIINCFEYLYLCDIFLSCIKPENIYLDNNNRIKISIFDSLNDDNNKSNDNIINIMKNCGFVLYKMLGGKNDFKENDKNIKNILYPNNISKDAVDLMEKMIYVKNEKNFGFNYIKSHPWFNLVEPKMRPGLIYNMNKIPVDENILDKVEKMGYDRQSCEKSILEEKYDSLMGIYLLLLNKLINEKNESIADLFSDKYLSYINDKKNLIDTSKNDELLYHENNLPNLEKDSKNINNLFKPNKEMKLFSSLIRNRRNESNSNFMSESLNLNDFSSRDLAVINNDISGILDSRNETIGFDQINCSRMFQTSVYNNESNNDSNLFLSTNEDKLSLKKDVNINKNKNISNKKYIKIKRKKKKENIKKPNIDEIINKRILKKNEINSKLNDDKKFHTININDNKSNINSKIVETESNFTHKNNNETDIQININNNDLNNNNFLNNYISSTPKKINIFRKTKEINLDYYNKTERKDQNQLAYNNSLLFLEEPLEKNIKYKLEKKIKEDITNFDKDLNILNNLYNSHNNKTGIDIQLFANKFIQTTNFEDVLNNNNKSSLEKYKTALILISKLFNKNNNDKISELNLQNIGKILEDKDDYIISDKLINNKYFCSFITKLKESRKKNMNKKYIKTRLNKSYFIESKNIFNISNYNLDKDEKNNKCELNNIIINQTQNNFFVKRPDIIGNKKKIMKSSKLKKRFINKYSLLKTFCPNGNDIQNLYNN